MAAAAPCLAPAAPPRAKRTYVQRRPEEWCAFLSSCAAMAPLMLLFGVGIYPNLVYAQPDPALGLMADRHRGDAWSAPRHL